MKKLLLLGMGVLLLSSAAFAASTGQGPTGLVCVPTADVVPAGNINFAADLFYPPFDAGVKPPDCYPFRLNYGVAQNWEIGVAYAYMKGANNDEVNAKYVLPGNFGGAKLAIGGQFVNFLGTPSRMSDSNVYLVATRDLLKGKSFILIGNVGATYDKLHNWLGPDSPNIVRPMAGLVLVLPHLHDLAFVADYIPKDRETGVLDANGNPHDTFSLAAALPLNKWLAVDAGFTTGTPYANAGVTKANILAGVKMSFSTNPNNAQWDQTPRATRG